MESVVDFSDWVGEGRPLLRAGRALREAIAAYVAISAPTGRRKWAQREWGLSADEARAVAAGTAGVATLEKVLKRGGWPLAIPVLAALIGEPLEAHEQRLIKQLEEEAQRVRARLTAHRARRTELANALVEVSMGSG